MGEFDYPIFAAIGAAGVCFFSAGLWFLYSAVHAGREFRHGRPETASDVERTAEASSTHAIILQRHDSSSSSRARHSVERQTTMVEGTTTRPARPLFSFTRRGRIPAAKVLRRQRKNSDESHAAKTRPGFKHTSSSLASLSDHRAVSVKMSVRRSQNNSDTTAVAVSINEEDLPRLSISGRSNFSRATREAGGGGPGGGGELSRASTDPNLFEVEIESSPGREESPTAARSPSTVLLGGLTPTPAAIAAAMPTSPSISSPTFLTPSRRAIASTGDGSLEITASSAGGSGSFGSLPPPPPYATYFGPSAVIPRAS